MDSAGRAVAPRWNAIFCGVLVALALANAGVAVARMLALYAQASLVASVGRDPTVDYAGQVQAMADLRGGLALVSFALFLGLIVTGGRWIRRLRQDLGTSDRLGRFPAYVVWRVGIWVTLLATFVIIFAVARPGPDPSVADIVRYDHQLMWFYVPRIVLGVFSVGYAVVLLRFSSPRLARVTPPAPGPSESPDARPRTW
jgi:hypothetical protein